MLCWIELEKKFYNLGARLKKELSLLYSIH